MNQQILLQSRKSNLNLVGEPGVGKTEIVEGFAQLMADGKLPEDLGRPAVRRVDTPVHQANGWRKESVICRRIFTFHGHVGETPTLLEAGSAGGSMDAANILKPALARGAIRVIGATTIREYRLTIEKDGALDRRFQMVRVEEPSAEEAVAILLALRPRLEEHHGVALEEAALRAAVEWSIRYLPDFRLPDKALDLVDQACAAVRFGTLSPQKRGDRVSSTDWDCKSQPRCGEGKEVRLPGIGDHPHEQPRKWIREEEDGIWDGRGRMRAGCPRSR